jgi:Family of unknown function (DUF6166)
MQDKKDIIWGHRLPEGVEIFIDGEELDPSFSQSIFNHSPDGFEYGYNGSGCAQLALAVLLHLTDDIAWSKENYQAFKREVIASLQGDHFCLPINLVSDWIKKRGGIDGTERVKSTN